MSATTLQTLADREAIRELKHYYYCYCADRGIAGDAAAMEELIGRLAPDVTTDFSGFPLGENFAAVSAFYRDFVPQLLSYSQHRVCNDVITVDGDRARGLWYFECPVVFRPGNSLNMSGAGLIVGRYEEEYVRHEGVWKWKKITALFDTFKACDAPWADAQLTRSNKR